MQTIKDSDSIFSDLSPIFFSGNAHEDTQPPRPFSLGYMMEDGK